MKVEKIVVGSLEENCYVIIKGHDAIIVDPGDEADRIIEFVSGYSIKGILVTHSHFDHVGALDELEVLYQLKANDYESMEDFNFEIYSTFGHTMDSYSFYFPEINSFFVGDFVFKHAIGRTDIGGDDEVMINSLKFLLSTFKDDVVLYPGHGESTTLGDERHYLERIVSL